MRQRVRRTEGGSRSNNLVRGDNGVFHSVNSYNLTAGLQKSAEMVKVAAAEPEVVRMTPRLYSPLYQESNLMLPKDRITVNAWSLHFYETDHWVGNAIDLHTFYPLGGFRLTCKYPKVLKFFEDMAEEMNLFELILDVGKDYWIFGESFPFLEWDNNKGTWHHGIVYNPDYMEVTAVPLAKDPILFLKPDEELRRVVRSYNPKDLLLREQLPPEVVDYVLRGENIPLTPRNITHVKRKSTGHHTRGTSILTRVFKELMLRDKLREAQFAIADNHVRPLRIFKIGSVAAEYIPEQDDLETWRDLIEEATYDQNFSIIAHDAFTVEMVGSTGSVLNIHPDIDRIEDNVLTGLFLSKAFTHSEGPTYANATVAHDILQKRYVAFRNLISISWLIKKVFKPVAEAQDFYEYDKGEKRLVFPEPEWDRLNLSQDREFQRILLDMAKPDPKTGRRSLSNATLLESLGMNYAEENKKIQEEDAELQEPKEEEVIGIGGAPGMGGPGMGAPGGFGEAGAPEVETVPEAAGGPGGGEGEAEIPEATPPAG